MMVLRNIREILRLSYIRPLSLVKKPESFSKSNFHVSVISRFEVFQVRMPSLSPTMVEGTIIKWIKKEGDSIQPGDIICDIQTDKAVVSFEVEEEGTLAKILVREDALGIQVGTLIALMVEAGKDWQNVEIPEEALMKTTVALQSEEKIKTSPIFSIRPKTDTYGPSVRLLLRKYGLVADQVPAKGPHEILLKGDILNFVQENNLHPNPMEKVIVPTVKKTTASSAALTPKTQLPLAEEKYSDHEPTSMRKAVATRLFHSKPTIAHAYCTVDCHLDSLLTLRDQLNKDLQISVNDFIIKSAAITLSKCPEVNCIWDGNTLNWKKNVDISVPVATEAGLIAPIVKGAQNLRLSEVSRITRRLVDKAYENTLRIDEFQGGTFTISNLGMFGIAEFTAMINPPQCSALAIGGSRIEIDEHGRPETRMKATLSYDRAAITDDDAALFMATFQEIVETPHIHLLGSVAKIDHPLVSLL